MNQVSEPQGKMKKVIKKLHYSTFFELSVIQFVAVLGISYLEIILRHMYWFSKKISPLSVAHTVAPSLQVTLLMVTPLSANPLT